MALVDITGYITRNDNQPSEYETNFYQEKYGKYCNFIDQGKLYVCSVNFIIIHKIRTHIFKPINKGNNLEHSRKKGSKPYTENSRPHILKPIKYFPKKKQHSYPF